MVELAEKDIKSDYNCISYGYGIYLKIHIKRLEMKTTIFGETNTLDDSDSRLRIAENKINKLEVRAIETT